MTLKQYVDLSGSVAEAARSLDVPYVTLSRWLKGKFKPSRMMVRMLASHGITG